MKVMNRYTGAVIFDCEPVDLKNTVEKSKAILRGAVLRGTDLRGAVLRGAVLRGADLRGADLRGAELRGAELRGAILRGAELEGADLRGAELEGAELDGTILDGADLRGADLRGAILEGEILKKCPIQLYNCGEWFVLITDNYLRIGCQRHTFAEWENFDDKSISDMSPRALEFWRVWKQLILAMCKVHSGV